MRPTAKETPMSVGMFQYDPLTFMSNNIVIPAVAQYAIPVAATVQLTLRPANGYRGLKKYRNGDLVEVPVFLLQLAGEGERALTAYWCPYEQNQLRQVQLSNLADYMFTAKMDGCSFGIGPQN